MGARWCLNVTVWLSEKLETLIFCLNLGKILLRNPPIPTDKIGCIALYYLHYLFGASATELPAQVLLPPPHARGIFLLKDGNCSNSSAFARCRLQLDVTFHPNSPSIKTYMLVLRFAACLSAVNILRRLHSRFASPRFPGRGNASTCHAIPFQLPRFLFRPLKYNGDTLMLLH